MRLGLRVAITLSILLPTIASCHRRAPVSSVPVVVPAPAPAPPPVPPSTLTLQSANRGFGAGDYAAAARDFEQYLGMVPSGGDRDQALFHLGLIYALPGDSRQDWQRSRDFFNRLVTEFPESSWKPFAQLVLSMRDQTSQLSVEVARMTNEAAQLRTEAAQLRNNSAQLTDQVTKLKTEADLLIQEAEKREQRIKQLNADLERLRKIDLPPRGGR